MAPLLPLPIPAAWEQPLHDFLNYQTAAGLSAATVATRWQQLRQLARELRTDNPWDVTANDIVTWAGSHNWSNERRRSMRQSLKAFWQWAINTGLTTTNPIDALPKVKADHPRPRPAPVKAIRDALADAGPRETLMLRLAAELGMRRGEVAKVHARDLILDDTGWNLIVHGKGGIDRLIPITDHLAAILRTTCTHNKGFAFPGQQGGHLSPATVGRLMTDLLPVGVTMHQLRHYFATTAYNNTKDLIAVQQLLGHSTPSTTVRYIAVTTDRHRTVAQAVTNQIYATT
jgi:integrase